MLTSEGSTYTHCSRIISFARARVSVFKFISAAVGIWSVCTPCVVKAKPVRYSHLLTLQVRGTWVYFGRCCVLISAHTVRCKCRAYTCYVMSACVMCALFGQFNWGSAEQARTTNLMTCAVREASDNGILKKTYRGSVLCVRGHFNCNMN